MTTTYFSVDVETSSTNPLTGDLLTIGAVVVNRQLHDNNKWHWGLGQEFYVRLGHDDGYVCWDDEATKEWWEDPSKTSQEARDEAYADRTLVRHDPRVAMAMFREWVLDQAATDDVHERVFCANPASFDSMWIDTYFRSTGIENPFSHRTLCLRSVSFGMEAANPALVTNWRDHQPRTHGPFLPHHALQDAKAQGLDLIDLLDGKCYL